MNSKSKPKIKPGPGSIHPKASGGFSYHNNVHAKIVGELWQEAGKWLAPGHEKFFGQVGSLHDVDPGRPVVKLRVRKPPTNKVVAARIPIPPRILETLKWLESNKTEVMRKNRWSEEQFKMAKAIIKRTTYPLNKKAANEYASMLRDLKPASRAVVASSAPVLSELDQLSFYLKDWRTALNAARGLVQEMRAAKKLDSLHWAPKNVRELGSARFLEAIFDPAKYAEDRRIARKLKLRSSLPEKNEAFRHLSPLLRKNFSRNLKRFKEYEEAGA